MAELAWKCLALLALVVSLWCSWRIRRERRRCRHTRYQGSAGGVVCLACRRDRERVADHVQRATGSRR